MTTILRVDPRKPDPEATSVAVEILNRGGVIVYPTDTVYGVGANALNHEATLRVFMIKNRPLDQAMPVAVSGIEMAEELALITDEARRLMEQFWPGALTILLAKRPVVPPLVTGGGDKIGLRAPNHPVPLSIIRASRLPLIATSANKHGQPNPMTAEEAFRQLGEMVDLVIDAGRSEVPIPSTVIDLTQELPAIIREGPVSRRSIEAVIGRIKNNT